LVMSIVADQAARTSCFYVPATAPISADSRVEWESSVPCREYTILWINELDPQRFNPAGNPNYIPAKPLC